MIALFILFIIFIIVAEYYSIRNLATLPKREHWTNYKSIVNRGRLSQNQARVIPMYNIALNPIQPKDTHFSWITFFDPTKFKQTPVNIAFR